MDTWFTNEPFINSILGEDLDMIGMLKDNKQLYCYQGRLYNLKVLSKLVAFNRAGNVFGSITVTTKKFNIPVKIVFVRPLLIEVPHYIMILIRPLIAKKVVNFWGRYGMDGKRTKQRIDGGKILI